jgi:hypothetical protein
MICRFCQYLKALWHHGLLFIGSAFFVLPSAAEYLFPQSQQYIDPPLAYLHASNVGRFVGFGVLLFLATFLAWKEERDARESESPIELKREVQQLSDRLKEIQNRDWQPLSGAKRDDLKSRLSGLPAVLSDRNNRSIEIVREEFSGCAVLAEDFARSFKAAGWSTTSDPDRLLGARIRPGIWVCALNNDPRTTALLLILQEVLGKEYEPIKYSEVTT